MTKIGIFLAEGFEEIEGLTVVDILRRAEVEVTMISITGQKEVKGSHQITVLADEVYEKVQFEKLDGIVLPGGMPGTRHLGAHEGVKKQIAEFEKAGKLVSAICAAPSVLGQNNILNGKKAVCYPGYEESLAGAHVLYEEVVQDGSIITSRGMGTAIPFALKLVEYLLDEQKAGDLAKAIIYRSLTES